MKGMTARHPGVPLESRGTFAGLAESVVLAHLADLGVTSVLLMPVVTYASTPALTARGLSEYWGYRTIARHRCADDALGAGRRKGSTCTSARSTRCSRPTARPTS